MLTLFMLMMLSASFSLFTMNTPISMGLTILFIALTLAWLFASMYSTWYAFLIFMIYVSGMLVIFTYFVAITPNQNINFKKSAKTFILSLTTLSMSSIMMNFNGLWMNKSPYISFLYQIPHAPSLIVMVLVLLITMILVVKITSRSKGPLRPFFYV